MPLLKNIKTPFGAVRITRSADGSLSYYQNGCFHSQADRNGVSLCVYVHVICALILQAKARSVLVVGCGGGTLATMLRRKKCAVTVVDINPAAFTIARDYFRLPRDVRCVAADGVAYLRAVEKPYDAIVIDVFDSHNNVPACFATRSFFETVRRALSPSGLMAMNLVTRDDTDRRAEKTARNAQAAGLPVRLFDWPGETDRNTIILGGGPATFKIPAGREPADIREDMDGMVCRRPKTKKRR